jgi:hypothetical protein
MAEVQKVGSLEIDQHIAFTLKEWRVERVAWSIFGLALVAAALGLLGGIGPFAVKEVSSADGRLQLQYSAITRLTGVPQFVVKADPGLAIGDTLTIALSTKLLEAAILERIEPEPETMIVAGAQQRFRFRVDPASSNPLEIRFDLKPDKAGLNAGDVMAVGGPTIPIQQFVWP